MRCFDAAAAGADLLGLGEVVFDAVVGEVVERGSPFGAWRRCRRRVVGTASGEAVASSSTTVSWRSKR